MKNKPVEFAGATINPGEQKTIQIPLAAMVTHNDLEMTAHVIHGKSAGPCLFISATIHGDEINGVEIIRRLLRQKQMNRISGTLIARRNLRRKFCRECHLAQIREGSSRRIATRRCRCCCRRSG